ncbi:hypothetical protein Trydic_g4990 [Trypoxylus dichotomus]
MILCLLLAFAKANERELQSVQPKIFPPFNVHFNPKLRENRIVGGENITPNDFPYQVGLFLEKVTARAFCGGSLISTNYVLTAGHSLVKLPQSIDFTDAIQKISLPTFSKIGDSFEGIYANFTGWGKTNDESYLSSTLLRAYTEIIGNRLCNIYFFGNIKDSHICTNGYRGQTPCNGDSGGPLVIDGVQVGIASFGLGLGCNHLWPGAFTRVTSYLDWIQQNSDVEILPNNDGLFKSKSHANVGDELENTSSPVRRSMTQAAMPRTIGELQAKLKQSGDSDWRKRIPKLNNANEELSLLKAKNIYNVSNLDMSIRLL